MSILPMDNHMHFRLSTNDKQMIEEAARLHGIKPNVYARKSLLAAAEHDLANLSQLNKVELSEEDWELFVQVLQAPVKENKNLKKAISRYKKYFGDM